MPSIKTKPRPKKTLPTTVNETPATPSLTPDEVVRLGQMPKTRTPVKFTCHVGPAQILVRVPAWQPQSLAIVAVASLPEALRSRAEAGEYLSALVNLDAQNYNEVIFTDWEDCEQTPIPLAPEARDKEATVCEVK